ncbi:MAG: hypothetical protein V3V67_15130 [Myxococcota bacterium]
MSEQPRPLSEADKKALTQQINAAASREAFRYASVLVIGKGRPRSAKNGSGTCIAIGERRFVATAAHNLRGRSQRDLLVVHEPERPVAPAETPVILKLGHTGGGGRSDRCDVGYIELDPATCPESTDCDFLPLDRIQTSVNYAPKDFVYICGFPSCAIPPEYWKRGLGLAPAMTFFFDTVDPAEWRSGLQPDRDIVIDYPEESELLNTRTGKSTSIDALPPSGLSGGSIWRVDPNVADPLWTPSQGRLIGIERSWRERSREIYGTQIQHWLQLVAGDYSALATQIKEVL